MYDRTFSLRIWEYMGAQIIELNTLNHIDSTETLLVRTRNPGPSRLPGRNHKVLVLDIEDPANAGALALDKGALRWW